MGALIAFAGVVVVWVLVSGRLSRRSVTGPIALTLAGLLLTVEPFGLDIPLESETVKLLIEVTLAVVLFTDASTVGARWFATEWRYPLRLLGIGLPLTILVGTLVAWWLFPGTDVWLAFVVAAALAPTDAALGTQIIEDERIPITFRRVINVESGLNDGLATPVVTFAIAGVVASDEGADGPLVHAVVALLVAVAVGALVGLVTGRLTARAVRAGWALPRLVPLVPLVVAVGSYALVVALDGNGFVAAFVAGVAFGGTMDQAEHEERMELTEHAGLLLGFAVWFLFGAALLSRVLPDLSWQAVAYAVLSLTVLRMLPVALSSVGLRLPWDTVALAGWLGPRGLASIVFAIIALDDIGGEQGEFVVQVVTVTVALSVLAHGLSAGPLAQWYAARHPVEADPVDA
ncbi:MAG: cation:proton antiporter [Candidatus Nanopelagicales bacterium]